MLLRKMVDKENRKSLSCEECINVKKRREERKECKEQYQLHKKRL